MTRVLVWRIQNLLRRWTWRVADYCGWRPTKSDRLKTIYRTEKQLRKDLQATGRKLRVGFIVCDRSKWSAGPLFELLEQDTGYECGFITTLSDTAQRMPKQARKQHYNDNHGFFSKHGNVWLNLYDQKQDRMLSISTINYDIVFIQQPWGMRDFPRQLADRVLCAYIPYGSSIISNGWMEFELPDFHGYLWRYFAQTKENKCEITASNAHGTPVDGAVVTVGYPKLDSYYLRAPDRAAILEWPRPNDVGRKRVIFAPHHSIGKRSLGLSTFLWSAQALKELIVTYPEIDFILKPHPNLGFELIRNKVMSEDQYNAWILDWETGHNTAIFDSGDYYGLFRTSDILITDSVSFLAEYLPANRPIIRLVNPGKDQLNQAFETLADAFYTAQTKETLCQLLKTIAIEQLDPLKKRRRSKAKQIMPFEQASSQRLLQVLSKIKGDRNKV